MLIHGANCQVEVGHGLVTSPFSLSLSLQRRQTYTRGMVNFASNKCSPTDLETQTPLSQERYYWGAKPRRSQVPEMLPFRASFVFCSFPKIGISSAIRPLMLQNVGMAGTQAKGGECFVLWLPIGASLKVER